MSLLSVLNLAFTVIGELCETHEVAALRSSCTAYSQMRAGAIAMTWSVCRWVLGQQAFTGIVLSPSRYSARVDNLLQRNGNIELYREHFGAWFLLQIRFKEWVSRRIVTIDGRRRRPALSSVVRVALTEVRSSLRAHWRHVLDSATVWDVLGGGGCLECPEPKDIDGLVRFIHEDDITDFQEGPHICIFNFVAALKLMIARS